MTARYELQILENTQVRQAKIHEGDVGWYLVLANDVNGTAIVSERFDHRNEADDEWNRRYAERLVDLAEEEAA